MMESSYLGDPLGPQLQGRCSSVVDVHQTRPGASTFLLLKKVDYIGNKLRSWFLSTKREGLPSLTRLEQVETVERCSRHSPNLNLYFQLQQLRHSLRQLRQPHPLHSPLLLHVLLRSPGELKMVRGARCPGFLEPWRRAMGHSLE